MKRLVMALFQLVVLVSYASALDFSSIGAEELKKLVDAKKQVTIVDARTEKEFREGHVPSAINVPPDKVSGIAALLPKDKNSLLVFYCRGAG
jgi:rhodanese-related sulfurtransferase